MLERNSVLVGVLKSGGRDGVGGERRLRVGEARGWRLVQVAAFPGTAMALATAVRPVLGTDLPTTCGGSGRRQLAAVPQSRAGTVLDHHPGQ